jgi:hypothetical protein
LEDAIEADLTEMQKMTVLSAFPELLY